MEKVNFVVVGTNIIDDTVQIDSSLVPFVVTETAQITEYYEEMPKLSECESEDEVLSRIYDSIRDMCNQKWGVNWYGAEILSTIMPESGIYR